MSATGSAEAVTVHAVALLIGETGLLVTGASGAGKSSFALAIAAMWRADPVRLIADDRVHLSVHGGRLIARPVAQFLGKIELRGHGIADVPAMPSGVIRVVLALQPGPIPRMPEQDIEFTSVFGVTLPLFRLQSGADVPMIFLARWRSLQSQIDHF